MTAETIYDVMLAEFDMPYEDYAPEFEDDYNPADEFAELTIEERPRIPFRSTLDLLKGLEQRADGFVDESTGKLVGYDRIAKESIEVELASYRGIGLLLTIITEGGDRAETATEILMEAMADNVHVAYRVVENCTDNADFRLNPAIKPVLRQANRLTPKTPLCPLKYGKPEEEKNEAAKPLPREFGPHELPPNLAVVHTDKHQYIWRHVVVSAIDHAKGTAVSDGILPNWYADTGVHLRTGGNYDIAEYNPRYHQDLRNAQPGSTAYQELDRLAKAVNAGKNVVIIGSDATQVGYIVATEVLRHAKILKHKPTQIAKAKAEKAKKPGPSQRYNGYEDLDEIRRQAAEENPPLTSGRRIYDYWTVREWDLGQGTYGPTPYKCVAGSESPMVQNEVHIDRTKMYITPKGEIGYMVAEYDDYLSLLIIGGQHAGEVDEWPRTKLQRMYVVNEFDKQHVDHRTGEISVEHIKYLPKMPEALESRTYHMLRAYYARLAEERRRPEFTTLARPLVGSYYATYWATSNPTSPNYVPSRYHGLSNSSRFDNHADDLLMARDYDALQSRFFAYADADEEALDMVIKGEMDVITAGLLSRSAGAEVIIKNETVTDENGRRSKKPVASKPRDAMRQTTDEADKQYTKMLEQAKAKAQERMLHQLEAKQAIVTALLRAGATIAELEQRFCPEIRPMLYTTGDGKKKSVLAPLAIYTNKTPVLVYDEKPLTIDEMRQRNGGRVIADVDALFAPLPKLSDETPEMLHPRPADVRQPKDVVAAEQPSNIIQLRKFVRRIKPDAEAIARRAQLRRLNEIQQRVKKAANRPAAEEAPKFKRSLRSEYRKERKVAA